VHLQKKSQVKNRATDLKVGTGTDRQGIEPADHAHEINVAEVASWYLYSSDAIPSIMEDNPDAKFVVCLRDPAEIAWALHAQNVTSGIENSQEFETAWALSLARREGRGCHLCDNSKLLDYTAVCSLGDQVIRLLTMVPEANIHFVFFDDIQSRSLDVWHGLTKFLQISSSASCNFDIKDVEVEMPKVPVHEILDHLRQMKRKVFPTLRTGLRIGSRLNGLSKKDGRMPPVPNEVRQKISDRLSEDIATLAVLSNRDLLHWIS
jgi:hypothetical protein